MSYIRDAAESTIRRLLVQFDEAHMLVVERFVVEQCLAQQNDSGSFAVGPCGDSDNSAPGAGPNQAGADGNGAAGQTFCGAVAQTPISSADVTSSAGTRLREHPVCNRSDVEGNGSTRSTFSPVPSALIPHNHADGAATFSGGDSTADPAGNGARSGAFVAGRCLSAETQSPGDPAQANGSDTFPRATGREVIERARAHNLIDGDRDLPDVIRGLRELRDAPAVEAAPFGVLLEWDMPEGE